MKIKKLQYLTALGLGLVMQNAFAGNIVDISVAALPNDQKVIKLRFDRDMVKPNGFITSSPARIALDFANTGVNVNQPVLQYNDSLLNQISVAQDGGKTRVLLNLNHPSQYNAEIRGNEVWVYVNRSSSTAAAAESTTSQPQPTTNPATASSAPSNVGIDFRKGNGNEGVIDITAAGFRGTPEIKQNADRLVILLKNNQLPPSAQRNLDVADFGTPVRAISLRRLGNDTEITVRSRGNWSHRLTQSGGRYSVTIQPQNAAAESGLNRQTRTNFTGKRISLDFQDVEVRTILQILAKESGGMNIVASDSVTGKMTISLKDVPWDQALDLVMQARNLDSRRNGNIINVAPKEELLAKERADLEGRKIIEEMGALYSRTFQLRYKDVNEFRKILNINENGGRNSNDSNSLLSARGSAVIDPGTNTLIIKDNATVIKQFEDLIAQLDVPARQVMIEARIVEANEGFSRDLGVRFGYNRSGNRGSVTGGWNTSSPNNGFNNWTNTNIPSTAGATAISVVHSFASGALNLELSAMEEQNRGKIVSSPRVLTQDRYEATIKEGVQIPYQEASSSGATSTSFKDAVLSMVVTPQITPDGKIIMNIRLNKDSVGENTMSGPSINTRELRTRAMVEDGGTIILGGIFSEEEQNTTTKVPLLGDIPVLGGLFRSTVRQHDRKELLLFITPRIMGDQGSVLRY